ncbi:MAG TPA: hypothetical protein VFX42_00375 [Gemmatimonadales bacterium]|nr:hypothetical protein [Gemmatimonadales bacterium]
MNWAWLALAALGAGHGLNPGMGWLFAVALGMQEGRTRAVWRALSPLALGHGLAIGAAVLTAAALGRLLPPSALQWIIGGSLLGLGMLRLVRHRHPRYAGMRVGFRELTVWSFLMATAHGAGLMVLPLLMGDSSWGSDPQPSGAHAMHLAAASVVPMSGPLATGLLATAMHTAGYLFVTGLIAVVVYRKLGLRMLRTMWINLDLIWGGALILTGAVALVA